MAALNAHTSKTTVSRLALFFITGFATSTPLFLFELFLGDRWSLTFMPIIILGVLFVMVAKEKRISVVKPASLEFFYATIGSFYPSILAAIGLWIIWWLSFVLVGLIEGEWNIAGLAYDAASYSYSVFSLGVTIFLVRVNWMHLVDQLYPSIGSQSAFAKISSAGKRWLFKSAVRALIFFVVFSIITFFVVTPLLSPGEGITIADAFLIGLFFVAIYAFFGMVSAWLWLRQPELPVGVPTVSNLFADMLRRWGYTVNTIPELKGEPGQGSEISEMTASVDLVAAKANGSVIVDIMTQDETKKAPDWIMASEFGTASWYLQKALKLSKPVEAFFVLVDIVPHESLFAFTESHKINVIQLTGEEVACWLAEGMTFVEKATAMRPLLTIVTTGEAATGELVKGGEQNA